MGAKCIEASCKTKTAIKCLTCGNSVCQYHVEYFLDADQVKNYGPYGWGFMKYVDKCNLCFDEEKDD